MRLCPRLSRWTWSSLRWTHRATAAPAPAAGDVIHRLQKTTGPTR
ncbi:MAG: hypothetical protein R2838_04020 [Caldilineaceae bacterium]